MLESHKGGVLVLTYEDYLKECDKTFTISTLNTADYIEENIPTEDDHFKYPLTPIGYDLKIGFTIIKKWNKDQYDYSTVFDLSDIPTDRQIDTTDDTNKQTIIKIPPKSGAIIVTLDAIYLSGCIAGTVHARSTLSAQGLMINSFTVDPNYKGRLIFYVFNSSQKEMILREKETIATLVLHKTKTQTEKHPQTNNVAKVVDNYKYCDSDEQKSKQIHQYLSDYVSHIDGTPKEQIFEKKCQKVDEYNGKIKIFKSMNQWVKKFIDKKTRVSV